MSKSPSSSSGPGSTAGPELVSPAPALSVGQLYKRFWPYARPYRSVLLLILPLIVVAPAIDTFMIWLFKVVVDDVLVPRDFGLFWWVALGYLSLTFLAGVIGACDQYLTSWVGGRFLIAVRTSLFAHLQSLSLEFFERQRLGDVISRLTSDVTAIESFVLSSVADALSYGLRIAFFTGAIFYLHWKLALVSFAVIPLFWLIARHFSRLIKEASRETRRRSGSLTSVAEESFSNAQLVQAYNQQETEFGRFHRETLRNFDAHLRSARVKALLSPMVGLVEVGGALVVIGFGTWQMSQGQLSLGSLLVFLTYLGGLYSPIRGLAKISTNLYAASAAAERIAEFLDQRPSVPERADAHSLVAVRGWIEFNRVFFRYPQTPKDALAEITFRVEPGETVALVGPSGAGKTTIAKLLLRFYDPTEGEVQLDGRDLRELRVHELREHIAVLFQEPLLFDVSIRENIAYGRKDATDEEIVYAAMAADAHDFIAGLADGYETRVGQKGRVLSAGQRQRIAIARAMIRNAPILILDEPTTGLDAESGQRVLEALQRLMSGRTTIVVAHNLMFVREASLILVLKEGRVFERGTHLELLAQGGLYAELYRLHQDQTAVPTLLG